MGYPNKQSPEAWAQQLNFAGLEREHGLPAGILTNLVRQESQGVCKAKSEAGALGLCQFMPKTAAGMGIDPTDPESSAKGAAKYLEQLMDLFDGDPEKAIAAYNWGQGHLRTAIKTYGNDWKNHLPAETTKYLAIVGKGIGKSFVQRQNDGEVISDEDKEAEANRRRLELQEAGLSPNMSLSGLLSSLFFSMIKSFLEKKMDSMEAAPPVLPPEVISAAEAKEAPKTPTVSRVAAVGNIPARP